MTLKQIRAMFKVGETWNATNSYIPKMSGPRKLVEMKSADFVWETEKCPRGFCPIPQQSQIIEARDGYLSFKLYTEKQLQASYITDAQKAAVITLERAD